MSPPVPKPQFAAPRNQAVAPEVLIIAESGVSPADRWRPGPDALPPPAHQQHGDPPHRRRVRCSRPGKRAIVRGLRVIHVPPAPMLG